MEPHKRIVQFLSKLTLIIFLSVCQLFSINKIRIALFEVRSIQTSEAYGSKLYSELRSALSNSKKLILVTDQKDELVKKLEEWKKSGCSEVECLTNAGLELNVEKIISGVLRQMPEGYFELDLIVVDVLSGEVDFVISSLREETVAKFTTLASKAVDAIESKIEVQPTIHAVLPNGNVIIDAGADVGVKKGMRYKVERWSNVQRDSRGKVLYVDKIEIGEIEILQVQPSGSQARIVSKTMDFEAGDKAISSKVVDVADEPPVIIHTPVQASVQGKDVLVAANIFDDKKVDGAYIYFRNKDEKQYVTQKMLHLGKDRYGALVNASEIKSDRLEYYMKAVDSGGQETVREEARNVPFKVMIIRDTDPPNIQHTPLTEVNSSDRVLIRAIVTDNVRVAQTVVFYWKPGQEQPSLFELAFQGGNAFAGALSDDITEKTNEFFYYIAAKDQAGNVKMLGSSQVPMKVNVTRKDISGPQIVHSPIKAYKTPADLTIRAVIQDESGIDKATVFVKKEYESKFTEYPLVAKGADKFEIQLGKQQKDIGESQLFYYLQARDKLGNESFLPSADQPFVIVPTPDVAKIATTADNDTKSPWYMHFPPVYPKPGLGFPVIVHADDATGISSVVVFHRGVSESRFRQTLLRKIGGGVFGSWIATNDELLQYYFVCSDVNQNISQVGDPTGPIVVKQGKIVAGKDKYSSGSPPMIPPPTIWLTSPAELQSISKIQGREFKEKSVTIGYGSGDVTIEGIIESDRQVDKVLIGTLQTNLLPPSDEELTRFGTSKRLTKFSKDIRFSQKETLLQIRADDIMGQSSSISLKITLSHIQAPPAVIVKKETPVRSDAPEVFTLKITNPSITSDENLYVSKTSIRSLRIMGEVQSNIQLKRILVNNGEATVRSVDDEMYVFEAIITTGVGRNIINVVAENAKGKTIQRNFIVSVPKADVKIADVEPPRIEIQIPHPQQNFNTSKIRVKAIISDNVRIQSVGLAIGSKNILDPNVKLDGITSAILEDEVELVEGKNTITINATDGENTAKGAVEVIYRPIKKAPPQIFVVSPTDTLSRSQQLELQFTVSNIGVNDQVGLKLNGKVVSENLTRGMKTASDPSKPVEFKYALNLETGKNVIVITAANEATSIQYTLNVTYIEASWITGNYIAVLIGVQDYNDPRIPTLTQPVDDVKKLEQLLLEQYSFKKENINVLVNPDKKAIFKVFRDLRKTITSNDNLFIFYAGHGTWDEKLNQGYWWPRDATLDLPTEWISNSDIKDVIKGINSKHTLLISDACFAGGLFLTRTAPSADEKTAKTLYTMPSRKAMTSGTLKEVPDKSTFMEFFLKRLKDNQDKYLTAEKLFFQIREPVINNSPIGQVPQFGVIRETGDEGGEFIFMKIK